MNTPGQLPLLPGAQRGSAIVLEPYVPYIRTIAVQLYFYKSLQVRVVTILSNEVSYGTRQIGISNP